MVLRKKCLNDVKTSERGNKKKVMPEFYGKQNFKGILLFNLIRRSLEFFANAKNRDDFLGFGMRRLMRGITTSRVSPLLVMTMKKNRLVMTDEKEVAGILGSCVASPRMTVEKGYCHLEPQAIARGCKDLINKCRDCIELTRLKQVRIKLKRDLYGDFACTQPLKMTMIICLILSLGVAGEARAADCAWEKDAKGNDTTKLVISGSGTFNQADCTLTNWTSKATEIEIKKGIEIIGDEAFKNMRQVKKLTIPDSVTSIGNSAFRDMRGVKKLTIPDSVTSIGNSAFMDMTGVTNLTIPNSVTSIGSNAFTYMYNVTGELKIPDSVTSIGSSAFSRMSGVQSLIIGNNVTSIDKYAFSGMSGVKNLTIGDSVTSVGEYAFAYMSGVKNLTIPDSMTTIGMRAFYAMTGIKSLTIPDSVTYIGLAAFEGMGGLTDLIISDNVNTSKWGDAFYGFTANANIVCLGAMNGCYEKLAKYFHSGDKNCPTNMTCKCWERCLSSSRIQPATEIQCNNSSKHYFNGADCKRRPTDGTGITCVNGYAKLKGNCVDPLKTFAKKRYTPAEAVQWLNEDNNTITLTFKKQ